MYEKKILKFIGAMTISLFIIAGITFMGYTTIKPVFVIASNISQPNDFENLEGKGCCSHHGGQSYCGTNGRWICQDGWESSCKCP